jgi:HSP20 family molecular chaperone IbpA
MTMKRSFFERLSGSPASGDAFDSFDDELPVATTSSRKEAAARGNGSAARAAALDDSADGDEGQLPVDVHQTASDIVIRAFVAGVRPDELVISISRDMVEISGSRMERDQIAASDYFTRELFWGQFSRTILLPQEIDVDASSAAAKDGLLTLILPRLDKTKQTKLRVKAG